MTKGIARLGHLILLASILAASGGHWAVLQVVAWGGMLVEYSLEGGIDQAAIRTFDGNHPCKLCNAIQKGRQSEKNKRRRFS